MSARAPEGAEFSRSELRGDRVVTFWHVNCRVCGVGLERQARNALNPICPSCNAFSTVNQCLRSRRAR